MKSYYVDLGFIISHESWGINGTDSELDLFDEIEAFLTDCNVQMVSLSSSEPKHIPECNNNNFVDIRTDDLTKLLGEISESDIYEYEEKVRDPEPGDRDQQMPPGLMDMLGGLMPGIGGLMSGQHVVVSDDGRGNITMTIKAPPSGSTSAPGFPAGDHFDEVNSWHGFTVNRNNSSIRAYDTKNPFMAAKNFNGYGSEAGRDKPFTLAVFDLDTLIGFEGRGEASDIEMDGALKDLIHFPKGAAIYKGDWDAEMDFTSQLQIFLVAENGRGVLVTGAPQEVWLGGYADITPELSNGILCEKYDWLCKKFNIDDNVTDVVIVVTKSAERNTSIIPDDEDDYFDEDEDYDDLPRGEKDEVVNGWKGYKVHRRNYSNICAYDTTHKFMVDKGYENWFESSKEHDAPFVLAVFEPGVLDDWLENRTDSVLDESLTDIINFQKGATIHKNNWEAHGDFTDDSNTFLLSKADGRGVLVLNEPVQYWIDSEDDENINELTAAIDAWMRKKFKIPAKFETIILVAA